MKFMKKYHDAQIPVVKLIEAFNVALVNERNFFLFSLESMSLTLKNFYSILAWQPWQWSLSSGHFYALPSADLCDVGNVWIL